MFYGPDGLPTTREYLSGDVLERRVALDYGPDVRWRGDLALVSTILRPCSWVSDEGPDVDLPFETLVFVNGLCPEDAPRRRYATRQAAEAGHEAIVASLCTRATTTAPQL